MRRAYAVLLLLCLAGMAGCSADPGSAGEGIPTASPSPLPEPPATSPWYVQVQPRPAEKLDELRDVGGMTDALPRPITREGALQFLLETRWFSDTAGGWGGDETTEQTFAFAALLAEPDAPAAFEELLKRGRLAGQLYGLCGLYLTNRPLFDRHVPRFLHRDESVQGLYGCVVTPRSLRAVAPEIASGLWPRALEEAARSIAPQP
jgi:hypothetical protein